MATISQSSFLQALGWATLNSFWQMALLWAIFIVLQQFINLSSGKKYALSISALTIGFAWYVLTFSLYFSHGTTSNPLAIRHSLAPTSHTWGYVLSSASVAYLLLLFIPVYRFFKNWQYIRFIKSHGLHKASSSYRLFVKNVANQLGINKNVQVFTSAKVNSPVTIGYLKPVILLPIAALNNLSTQQVEAVLLHELSHIRRYDYLINFIITLLHTFLYFNPFVKKFVEAIETEREKCCDELVLQFGYDKIGYASALLALEKNAHLNAALALGATGKKSLLNRIEKIVGQEKKTTYSFPYFAGLMMSLLLVLFINSVFFAPKESKTNGNIVFTSFDNPLYTFGADKAFTAAADKNRHMAAKENAPVQTHEVSKNIENTQYQGTYVVAPEDELFLPVAFDAADANLNEAEKEQVKATVEATKKVLATNQWKEVETAIADGMTAAEKVYAKQEYLNELQKVNWKSLELQLKTDYRNIDWLNIQAQLGNALMNMKLDSLQQSYTTLLNVLEKTDQKLLANQVTVLPIPDVTEKQVKIIKDELRLKIDSINTMINKKVVDF